MRLLVEADHPLIKIFGTSTPKNMFKNFTQRMTGLIRFKTFLKVLAQFFQSSCHFSIVFAFFNTLAFVSFLFTTTDSEGNL